MTGTAGGAGAEYSSLPVPGVLLRVSTALGSLSRATLWLACGSMVLVIGIIDQLTGAEFAFSIFYLLPISIAAWHLGWRPALAMVVSSGLTWLAADRLAGHVYDVQAVQYWNALVRTGFFLIVAWTLTLLRQALGNEARLARTDGLTGLANARSFAEMAERELARARREKAPATIAFIDLDGFKQINDRMGHAAGDELLCAVANILRSATRGSDVVARLGGDEFAVLLPGADQTAARLVMGRVLDGLRTAAADRWPIGLSVGVLTCPAAPESVATMLAEADALMYEVKRAGGHGATYLVSGGAGERGSGGNG